MNQYKPKTSNVAKLTDEQIVREANDIVNWFHKDPAGNGGRSFGCDWATMWMIYPEHCMRYRKLQEEMATRHPMSFTVVVSNIGTVHKGYDENVAKGVFDEYVEQSKSGLGRAGGENVSMFGGNVSVLTGDAALVHNDIVHEYSPLDETSWLKHPHAWKEFVG